MNDWMANDYLHPSSKKESNFKNESEKKLSRFVFFMKGLCGSLKKGANVFSWTMMISVEGTNTIIMMCLLSHQIIPASLFQHASKIIALILGNVFKIL